MILTLKENTSRKQISEIIKKIKKLGFKPHISHGARYTVIGVIGENAIKYKEHFEGLPQILSITPISKPYKLVSRELKSTPTKIKIDDLEIGGEKIIVIAGPCSVESLHRLIEIAKIVKSAGANILRGGAFKPRTNPYSFQGLGLKGLEFLKKAKNITGLPIITEVMNINQVDVVAKYVDILQVGTRNMQNFDLLKELGKIKKPVLLKRGMSNTVGEWLMSAEYIYSHGNSSIILCERGIRTFETATRFTLDLNIVPLVKKLSHLPIFVDPSHGVGIRDLVPNMAKAAIACGADGVMLEVHSNPELALSDGQESLYPSQFENLMKELKLVAKAIGREIF